MRTTVELPDHLLKNAKRFALEHDLTLKDVLIQGLERVLTEAHRPSQRLQAPPIQLSPKNPLRRPPLAKIKEVEAGDEAAHLHEVYRRR